MIPLKPLCKQYEVLLKTVGPIVLTAQVSFDKILAMSNLKLLREQMSLRFTLI